MSVYLAEMTTTQAGASFNRMVLTPVSLPIKVLQVSFVSGSGVNIYRSTGVGTGGTSLTPVILRGGAAAPAATTTAKYNVTSVSGTASYFTNTSTVTPFQPLASLIIPVGNILVVDANTASQFTNIYIYFDELEIQPGY